MVHSLTLVLSARFTSATATHLLYRVRNAQVFIYNMQTFTRNYIVRINSLRTCNEPSASLWRPSIIFQYSYTTIDIYAQLEAARTNTLVSSLPKHDYEILPPPELVQLQCEAINEKVFRNEDLPIRGLGSQEEFVFKIVYKKYCFLNFSCTQAHFYNPKYGRHGRKLGWLNIKIQTQMKPYLCKKTIVNYWRVDTTFANINWYI